MLPKINNKSFLECTESDLEVLIDNLDYRENEYLDYKKNFAFLEIPKDKKELIASKVSEFRSDVCAFANAEGGYLIFGISDENGCAEKIVGIEIPNDDTDKFELDRRNNLNSISPRTPYLKFHFIKLQSGRYVVIIFVKRDSFAPYTHVENESSYFMYKRSGNGKRIMSYTEMKNMFNQSLSLDKEIHRYRTERIDYYRSQAETEDSVYSRFMLLHIIPETFLDPDYNHNVFVIEKKKCIRFSDMFVGFECNCNYMPCVDGLRYIPYRDNTIQSECYVKNNGVVECFFPLDDMTIHIEELRYPDGFLSWGCIWGKFETTCIEYAKKFKEIYPNQRIFMCLSIVGCKGVISENEDFDHHYFGKIDRNLVLCSPVFTSDLNNEDENDLVSKKLYIEFLLSIGVKYNEKLTELIQEVYDT